MKRLEDGSIPDEFPNCPDSQGILYGNGVILLFTCLLATQNKLLPRFSIIKSKTTKTKRVKKRRRINSLKT